MFNVPYSTCERIVKQSLNQQIPELQSELLHQAQESNNLVLGIDDFTIRKGHSYNTGFRELKNESLLLLAKGRTYTELSQNKELNQQWKSLTPVAIVMDLAGSYHKFYAEIFPFAIRNADRFHVNHYIMDDLQAVRRSMAKQLTPRSTPYLKRTKHLLGNRADELTDSEPNCLVKLLSFSGDLAQVYRIKEALIDWYDLSHASNSYRRLVTWIKSAKKLNIQEVNEGIKPFEHWTTEISNYYKYRYTKAAVQGRHNKLKMIQRRSYFWRNRISYENKIYQECNYQ